MDQPVGPSLTRSRFVLLDRPYAHPGICKVCGAVDRPVIDFGASDDIGAIYFCTDCLTEVAKGALNLVDASDLDEARLANLELQEKLNSLGGNLNDYINNLHNLHDAFISGSTNLLSVDDQGTEELSGESSGSTHGDVPDSESGKSASDRPDSVEGSISVPASSSDESGFFSV